MKQGRSSFFSNGHLFLLGQSVIALYLNLLTYSCSSVLFYFKTGNVCFVIILLLISHGENVFISLFSGYKIPCSRIAFLVVLSSICTGLLWINFRKFIPFDIRNGMPQSQMFSAYL